MTALNVVVHHESGAVFAAVTTQDGRPRDEIVGDVLPIVADFDSNMELPRQTLRAYKVAADASVLADPMGRFVKVPAQDGEPIIEPTVDTISLDLTALDAPRVVITPNVVETRRAWLIVKSPGTPARELASKVIGQGDQFVSFTTQLQSGDVVLGIVEKHRPILDVVP